MARVVIPGCPHHVTQRGNRREDVFFTAADHERYLGLLADYAEKHGLAVQAHCLMTNHVHLVVVPQAEAEMIARLRQCTHTGRPAGGSSFIARLEALVGRALRAKKVGRPRKHKPADPKTGKEHQDDKK